MSALISTSSILFCVRYDHIAPYRTFIHLFIYSNRSPFKRYIMLYYTYKREREREREIHDINDIHDKLKMKK